MPAGGVFTSAIAILNRFGAGRLLADRRAVTAVEYAIIAGIMALAVFGSVPAIGPELSTIFNKVSAEL
jgi:pilus assembly protein Flp/PilA